MFMRVVLEHVFYYITTAGYGSCPPHVVKTLEVQLARKLQTGNGVTLQKVLPSPRATPVRWYKNNITITTNLSMVLRKNIAKGRE